MLSKRTKPRLSWWPRFSNMRFLQDPMATWVPSYEFFIGKAMLVHWTHLPHLSQLKMIWNTSDTTERPSAECFNDGKNLPGWCWISGCWCFSARLKRRSWLAFVRRSCELDCDLVWCCYSKNGWPDGRSFFNKLVEPHYIENKPIGFWLCSKEV